MRLRTKLHESGSARPGVFDRIKLASSAARHLDGLWVGGWPGMPEDLAPVERALLLVKQHSPLDYARINRDLERVWVQLLPHGRGEYNSSLKACLLDERFVADPATSAAQIASTIVHEATHARLERYGIEYKEEQRARIEAICFRRELAFVARLHDSSELQQDIARCVEHYRENPDYFSDANFQDRRADEEADALRYLGVPNWLIRAMLVLRSAIGRVRSVIGRVKRLFVWKRGDGTRSRS